MKAKSNKVRVLVVDDEPEICDLIAEEVCQRLGVETLTAADGRSAIVKFGLHRPRVVVTDLNMPDGDGYEFLRRLRQLADPTGLSIIVASASIDQSTSELLAHGADAVIPKPFEIIDMVTAIERELKPLSLRWELRTPALEILPIAKLEPYRVSQTQIGRGGFFVSAKEQPTVGSLVEFKIETSDKIELYGIGRVVWSRQQQEQVKLPSGFGVEFVSLDKPCIDSLAVYLSKAKPISYIPQQ